MQFVHDVVLLSKQSHEPYLYEIYHKVSKLPVPYRFNRRSKELSYLRSGFHVIYYYLAGQNYTAKIYLTLHMAYNLY